MPLALAPGRVRQCCRLAWAAPCSLLGLLLALPLWLAGARGRVVHGVLELAFGHPAGPQAAHPRQPAWLRFSAITLGHVVLGVHHQALAQLRTHEHAHVRQYERWGALLLLAYPASSLLQWLRGRDPYWHNHFEQDARAQERRAAAQTSNRTPCASGNALE